MPKAPFEALRQRDLHLQPPAFAKMDYLTSIIVVETVETAEQNYFPRNNPTLGPTDFPQKFDLSLLPEFRYLTYCCFQPASQSLLNSKGSGR